ncbi:hypothetical protein TCAL_15773 [Tigriopus californicus]|uniref:Uncharacterized protein n=1 Tax=Tigriopus californicus TaxID=6832 RepID=A0A553P6A9_TIGCA|nr:hypothetical protein TCAL_15773 [Tigriopus californicus]
MSYAIFSMIAAGMDIQTKKHMVFSFRWLLRWIQLDPQVDVTFVPFSHTPTDCIHAEGRQKICIERMQHM